MSDTTLSSKSPRYVEDNGVFVELTHDALSLDTTINKVRSPKAGAIVMFAGTTRDNFDSKAVSTLTYTSYTPLALNTLYKIGIDIKVRHKLIAIAITHRLGEVGVGEESVHIVVSSPHRQEAWKAGEECLNLVKDKAEIWKLEHFDDGSVWRANRDGQRGVQTGVVPAALPQPQSPPQSASSTPSSSVRKTPSKARKAVHFEGSRDGDVQDKDVSPTILNCRDGQLPVLTFMSPPNDAALEAES
ncbi:Molybdopterin biosynthesis MoaE [Geopyxis carbonaria]|nr:Molybdopterin biosynthesis MoaE [Geopyxis carbonaria]